jgi:hypothetical protein
MASVSPSAQDEVKESIALSKDSECCDSSDCETNGQEIAALDSKDDAGDLTYNTLPPSASQMLLKPTDHIRRLSRVFVNFFQSVPTNDPILSQRLQDNWAEFTRKYPFFFSIVHRKFKLENDFSFRIHTRTLFSFELPPDTALKVRVDTKKAKSLFGDDISLPRFHHIFRHPRILELSAGDGDYVEMAEARELVKLVCDSLCPTAAPTGIQDLVAVQPFLDNVPMFSLHVVFCSQGAGARSRCRHSMIQLLRREFITMLASIVLSCAFPDSVDDVQKEDLETNIAKCWDSDVIEKQSQQESLWMKISLRLYTLIGTLMNTGNYDDQRLGLVLRLWKQADQNAEAQLHRAKDVQRKRRRSIDDRNVSSLLTNTSLEAQGKSKASLLRQGLEGNGIGPWNLGASSLSNSIAMLPALSNQLQQLQNMLQLQQLQHMAHMNPGQLQAFQFMQQQQSMQQQLMNQQLLQPPVNPFPMTGFGVFPSPSNFHGHDKLTSNSASMALGPYPSSNQIWPGMHMPDSYPSPSMIMHPGNGNPNSMNALFNSMSNPSFPCIPSLPSMSPFMGNQHTILQMLGGGLHLTADPLSQFSSATESRAFVPIKSSAFESGQKHDLASGFKKRSLASESNGSATKLEP